jgi:viologen exporter family transport system permease protein
MTTVRRYLRLLRVQLRTSATTAMQYRTEFLLKGVMAVFWLAITIAPLAVVYGQRPSVKGWTYPEALVVLGWFSLLKAVLEGGVTPSLTAVVEGVRTGALDFVLLKPADAQFLVSTAKFEPWRAIDFLGAAGIFAYAFHRLGHWPSASNLFVAAALLVMAVLLLYSIWILVVSASFWVVRVDNLSYLFGSLFDAGRWPVDLFGRTLRLVFTFVFPLALMTTYPAKALLGRLTWPTAALALAGGAIFAVLARQVWKRAVGFYTSASS